ncbi:AAA family ATPase [Candidatus Aminicenantes bacterium AC-708-M15]|jgi:ATP-dependent Lon protease|nr:AAA family ATPase [SCandidatus Aminicenantes bacterium Aminicenantia_JdfR_composite]MCP2596491.1 AAA family ATPase [Candidatus Aminicenantes bacterium AC-335-G13]MCP2603886.1 AAA family ATPase [Candidatus Aminicenantes bacterium AC-708-M15]MCP2618085.1 AAA family ATPase [Candidatus Aminicenantes bacterium AC-335-A11]
MEIKLKRVKKFKELPPEKLKWRCDPDSLGFNSTDELKPFKGIIGQDRAIKSIELGLKIKSAGYNIFVTGVPGTGRSTTIKNLLEELDKGEKSPDDLLYVNNFQFPDHPRLITLPAGKGRLFKEDMENLIKRLKEKIPEVFKSKFYMEKKESIIKAQQEKQKKIIERFEKEAAKQGFRVIQVQMGPIIRPDLIPLINDQPLAFDKLKKLVEEGKFPKEEYDKLNEKYEHLIDRLEEVAQELKEIDEETKELIREWDVHSVTDLIKEEVNRVRKGYQHPKIKEYLDEVESNLIKDIDLFRGTPKEKFELKEEDPFIPYRVNLLVDNSQTKGAPVIIETNPTYINLFGTIEIAYSRTGAWKTDFTKIKAGSLLRANGGYLVFYAMDALLEPGVWTTLKRTLRNQVIEIQAYNPGVLITGTALKPEPIKADVKVVLIGDEYIYQLLYHVDEDFKKIFKVKAEFDYQMPKEKKTIYQYCSFLKKICEDEKLLPFDKTAVAALIEYGVRLAGRQNKLSTRFNIIADVIREADYWARKEKKKIVRESHVKKAIYERFERVSLIEDKIQELIEEGTIMIDTEGEVVGQVNGLSIYQIGEFMFGKPTRITAKTSIGRSGIISIEREAALSGRTHDKGVLILTGYLRSKYAQDKPLTVTASICFEQSYSGVDGDSASSTEVYAILSSLSGLPLRQDIAVTGSLNQKGEIQPIGGVNEKIEGFFDVCKAKGLTGTQGVIIPEKNVKDLMLRDDVIQAVKEGKFHIYPIKTIDEGIEILTGVKAGKRKPDGTFEKGTVNYLVDKTLREFAEQWKEFTGGEIPE